MRGHLAILNFPEATLKLIVEKGPSSGQALDFRPGSRVNIGRLVRGNSIAIKDSGISSKHLRIELDADRRRWIITDLGSSNGTFLNGDQLDPLEPAALSDGDLIKFGEETSIRVEFVVVGAENEAGSVNVRRNARRRVRGLDAELGFRNSEGVEKVAEIEAKQGKSVGTRRTRNSAKNENLANDLGISGVKVSVGVSTRRTRNSKKEENVDEIAVDVCAIELKKPGGRGRGRKKQPVETISEEIEKEEPKSIHKACEEERERTEVAADELEAEVKNSGTDGAASGLASSSGVKECNVEDAGKEKIVPDLEKMTLGEWFEYIQVHETRYIIDKSEEMLAEMRRKAERCHEYMLQQKRLRG